MAKILKSNIPYKGPETENLSQLIVSGLKRHASRILLIDSESDCKWTGKQIDYAVANISHYLINECKLKKGNVCSVYGDDCDRIAILKLAIVVAGGVVSLLPTTRLGRDVRDTALAMKSKFLLTTPKHLTKIHSDIEDIEGKIQIILFDKSCNDHQYPATCKDIASLLCQRNAPKPSVSCDELVKKTIIEPQKDFAIIQYSSGTTGKPKPIPRTHKNLCHLVATPAEEDIVNLKPGDIVAGTLSLSYRPGTWILLSSVVCGSTMVILSNKTSVDTLLSLIAKYKVTLASFSLPLLSKLAASSKDLLAKHDISSLNECITAGAKILNEDLPRNIINMLKLRLLRQSFGMTESGLVFILERSVAMNSSGADRFLSVGHVTPGTEAKIIDPGTGKMLGPNEHGEIAIRGPQIFPGYLQADKSELNRSDFDADGFFRIGDRGYYTSGDELVFIEGRFKELLIFENNARFFPSDIETIILEKSSLIEDVCVVKIGQVLKDFPIDIARAYVIPRRGAKVSEQDLLDFLERRAPVVILAGGIRFVESFPRFPNGKIDKKTLTSLLAN